MYDGAVSKRAFTPEQDQQIADEYAGGKTLRELAAAYGCSAVAVANSLKRSGCDYRHPSGGRTRWAPGLADDAVRRYREGEPIRALARRYTVRGSTILALLVERGEKRNRPGRPFMTPEQHRSVRELYEAGASLKVLAKQFDCSTPAITRAIIKAGGETRGPGVSRVWTDEVLRRVLREYQAGRTQESIAAELGVSPTSVRNHLQRAATPTRVYRNPASGKGRHKTGEGYVWAKVTPDHPMFGMANIGGYIPEHRLVMAESLGRLLLSSETVHHKNGVKDDNRVENLQLRHGNHGKGVVMVCMDCGSHNVGTMALA